MYMSVVSGNSLESACGVPLMSTKIVVLIYNLVTVFCQFRVRMTISQETNKKRTTNNIEL